MKLFENFGSDGLKRFVITTKSDSGDELKK